MSGVQQAWCQRASQDVHAPKREPRRAATGLLGTERFVGGGNAFWRAATIGQNRCAIAVQQLRERIDVKGGTDRGREERPIV